MSRLKEVAGVGLIFFGTSCGIVTASNPKPEATPPPPEKPSTLTIPEIAAIATPAPVPAFTSEFAREEALDNIKSLVQVLQDYINPQITEPLNSLWFDRLSRSTDKTIIDFSKPD